jgi:hypothetical protein
MKWEYNSIPGWNDWSSEEGYMCSQYLPDPRWYAGINLGEAYLDLGSYNTLKEAKGACERNESESSLNE